VDSSLSGSNDVSIDDVVVIKIPVPVAGVLVEYSVCVIVESSLTDSVDSSLSGSNDVSIDDVVVIKIPVPVAGVLVEYSVSVIVESSLTESVDSSGNVVGSVVVLKLFVLLPVAGVSILGVVAGGVVGAVVVGAVVVGAVVLGTVVVGTVVDGTVTKSGSDVVVVVWSLVVVVGIVVPLLNVVL
jgi:hypothetical protein